MILATLAVYFYFSLGFHKSVELEEVQNIHFRLLAQPYLGAYHKISPTIEAVEKWAAEHNIPCKRSFGEYLDDPRAVDEARLRAYGGCVAESFPKMQATPPIEFRPFIYPRVLRARFYGSPSIGPMKVYPQVEAWMNERNLKKTGSVLEVYVSNGLDFMTEFYFPIKND